MHEENDDNGWLRDLIPFRETEKMANLSNLTDV